MPVNDPATAKSFFWFDLIAKTEQSWWKGLGVMYWTPVLPTLESYGLGAFDASGKSPR